MTLLNLFVSYEKHMDAKSFKKSCRRRKIKTKTVSSGIACNEMVGFVYRYKWIETKIPNYWYYSMILQKGELLDVFFYNERDRDEFIAEFGKIEKFSIIKNSYHEDYCFFDKGVFLLHLRQ